MIVMTAEKTFFFFVRQHDNMDNMDNMEPSGFGNSFFCFVAV